MLKYNNLPVYSLYTFPERTLPALPLLCKAEDCDIGTITSDSVIMNNHNTNSN